MKEKNQNQKKLSLKKIQLTKLNNLNSIVGGNYNGGNDDTIATKPPQTMSGR